MFERFTKEARAVVYRAVAEAEGRDSPVVGTEHVLLALADERSPGTRRALQSAGLDDAALADVMDEVELVRRRGGLGPEDAEALAGIGIDLDAVVAGIEEEHGAGALVPPARSRRRGLLRRLPFSGHRPFTSGAKKSLELSLREALEEGVNELRPGHILLGVLGSGDPVAQELARRGITPLRLRPLLRAG